MIIVIVYVIISFMRHLSLFLSVLLLIYIFILLHSQFVQDN